MLKPGHNLVYGGPGYPAIVPWPGVGPRLHIEKTTRNLEPLNP